MKTSQKPVKTVHIEHCEARSIKCTARQDIPECGIATGEIFLLRRIAKNTYILKRITVLSREVASDGSITCEIANDEGRHYTSILRRNKQHECGCDATVECYHLTILRAIENARAATAKMQRQTKPEQKPITDISTRGNLNGNGGFSVLKAA